jgi:hypothetical protein
MPVQNAFSFSLLSRPQNYPSDVNIGPTDLGRALINPPRRLHSPKRTSPADHDMSGLCHKATSDSPIRFGGGDK